MRRPARYLALVAATVATPALADWGPTHWQADTATTLAALGPDAKRVDGGANDRVFGQDLRIEASGTVEGVAVTERFFFDRRGGLALVKLIPTDFKQCVAFTTAIRTRYGTPVTQNEKTASGGALTFTSATWNDRAADQAIMLVSLDTGGAAPAHCHVTYQPFGKDGTPGARGG